MTDKKYLKTLACIKGPNILNLVLVSSNTKPAGADAVYRVHRLPCFVLAKLSLSVLELLDCVLPWPGQSKTVTDAQSQSIFSL